MRKKIKISLVIIASFILLFVLFIFSDPYSTVRNVDSESGDGTFYLKCYENFLSHKKFDTLVVKLIRDNMDLKSMMVVAGYVSDRKLCRFKEVIESKYKYLSSLPSDSSWKVQISSNYFRVSKVGGTVVHGAMFHWIDELNKNCK
jgi:hypothetical protein